MKEIYFHFNNLDDSMILSKLFISMSKVKKFLLYFTKQCSSHEFHFIYRYIIISFISIISILINLLININA